MTFIYGLVDPRTDRIRYIGKSDNPEERLKVHLRYDNGWHKDNWINQLLALNLKPILEILEEVDEEEWSVAEQQYIWAFGSQLTNMTKGGEGCRPTEATRANMSAAQKGNQNSKGHKLTAKVRAKISAANKGNQNSLGHRHTEESRAKMRGHAPTNTPVTEESRAKMSVSAKLGWVKRRAREAAECPFGEG